MTVLLGRNRIKKGKDRRYEMAKVSFLLLMLSSDVHQCVLNAIVTVNEICAKTICTIIYTCKIPTYNMMSKIRVLITLRAYFWT